MKKQESKYKKLKMSHKDFTIWQQIKAMISDRLLMWALELLPNDSPECDELAVFFVRILSPVNRPTPNKIGG